MQRSAEARVLPGTTYRMVDSFTGFKPVDKQLQVLLAFFWPIIDGSAADYGLHAFNFAGQAAATWMVLMVDGLKDGNHWRPVSLYVCLSSTQ